MTTKKTAILIFCLYLFLIGLLGQTELVMAEGKNQQPTISIPTVTGTPEGVIASVSIFEEGSINVRSGPNAAFFEKVGELLPGQKAPVLGRTSGGDWLKIRYFGAPNDVGWVSSNLVNLTPGEVPIVESPPTPGPQFTETINPTLAAQFITTPIPTRLSTFTPATPLIVPTYQDLSRTSLLGSIPMGFVILILAGLGGLLALFSVIRR